MEKKVYDFLLLLLLWKRRNQCCSKENKMHSYRRETVLQGALVLAKSGRLELGDNILLTL